MPTSHSLPTSPPYLSPSNRPVPGERTGAPTRVPTQRSTPDSGANAQPALWSHLPGKAGARGAHERAPALCAAPPREASECGRGGSGQGRAEGRWRSERGGGRVTGWSGGRGRGGGGRRGQVRGKSSAAGESGAPGGGVAHRGRLLKLDIDAVAGGFFDDLLGLVVEAVVPQAATGRPQGSDVGARVRPIHSSDRRGGLGPHGARWRAAQHGNEKWVGRWVSFCERIQKVLRTNEGMCSERDKKQRKKAVAKCQRALTERRTGSAQGAPQRGHGAALEPLAQLGDAPSSVLAVTIIVKATELVAIQAVKAWG
jgi:hypothetical protein